MRKRHTPSPKEDMILPDQPFATSLGFTSDKFNGYLWKDGQEIWVAVITSIIPNHGNLGQLFHEIQAQGYRIVVSTPFGRMTEILKYLGFKKEIVAWESSPNPLELPSNFPEFPDWIWQHHKMGVMLKGTLPDNKADVEIWRSPK